MPEDSPPLQVKAIDHITLVVDDLERSAHFYVDQLGMRRTERPPFKFPGLWFQAGATQIHLILKSEQSGEAGLPPPPETAAVGRTLHFAFEVKDGYAAAETLKQLGIRIRGGPSLRPDGCVQTWCYDPDGYVVELFSRPGQATP